MPTKDRAIDAGTRRARALVAELGRQIRDARVTAGLSQRVIAATAGLSTAQVSRIERGLVPRVSVYHVARLMAIVGLELGAKGYPGGDPLRDEAHRRLLDRLVAAASPEIVWRNEVPVGPTGDPRAWDSVGALGRVRLRVEAETACHDHQALLRKLALKRRDDPQGGRLILLLANTRANRAFVGANEAVLRADLPIGPRAMLTALREGRDPGGDGYLML